MKLSDISIAICGSVGGAGIGSAISLQGSIIGAVAAFVILLLLAKKSVKTS